MSGEHDPARSGAARRWVVLVASLLAVSTLHYLTPPAYAHWHVVYQRLYYLPLLFGAFWFGLWGGLAVAVLASAMYLPHIVLHWGHNPLYRSNQLAEILMFVTVGTVAGALIDRIRREREEHRRTARELEAAYRQLQTTFERLRLVDRLSALGALSAGVAHEIKNPLGSILGSIEILESRIPPGDDRREFVEILEKEIRRLSRIVSSQLDLVRPARPERGPHDLGEVARSVVELARKQADRQRVSLTLEVADGLPTVMIDGQLCRQAILNLVLNSLQALPEGGRVVVRVDRVGERLRVSVEDDGPGLGEEALRRAFEPFFTTKDGGTGLGLSIAFQIADSHGGDLRGENRPGGGARFVLEIPLAAAWEAAAPAAGMGA